MASSLSNITGTLQRSYLTDPIMANVSTGYSYLFKMLLCGDSGVGKTSMLCRFVGDKMNNAYIATVGTTHIATYHVYEIMIVIKYEYGLYYLISAIINLQKYE